MFKDKNANLLRAEILSWIGTPFHLQQCVKGVGVDCLNLPVGIASNLGIVQKFEQERLTYSLKSSPRKLLSALSEKFQKGVELQPYSIVCVAWVDRIPAHIAIHLENNIFVNADNRKGVVTFRANSDFLQKINSIWEF